MNKPTPTQQAAIGIRIAANIARAALKTAAPGSQDEANVTEILATLEPLALKFPAPTPEVPSTPTAP